MGEFRQINNEKVVEWVVWQVLYRKFQLKYRGNSLQFVGIMGVFFKGDD